jgi:hypothetical protein
LVHQFRQNPHREFFVPPAKGPHKAPKKDKNRICRCMISAAF